MRERLALPVLLVLSTLAAFGAGITWMTHMHHRGLRYLDPERMPAYDQGYEQLSDLTVIPAGVAGLVCAMALLLLRPRGVPLWMIGLSLCMQASIFVARVFMWGAWADEVREAGSIWQPDGTLHPAYTDYMDLNWIRIVIISGYALLALVMATLAVSRRGKTSNVTGPRHRTAEATP
ncbi:hypothetical protein SMC26_10255 [Actinomadura fulvescens]|uniref:DUF1772 domain-containing protein n=1 Tax=Actinomadura fulvescens TaxID=46160 RepID=A0ABP6CHE4_9ACTN